MSDARFRLKRCGPGLALLAALLSVLVSVAEGQKCDPCVPKSTAPTLVLLHTWAWGADGAHAYAGLVRDPQGNLYGTTSEGGGDGLSSGVGTVFKITPTGELTLLYIFNGDTDGRFPYGNLVLDAQGNLYGTTVYGGAFGEGTVFKVTPAGTETVLHSFSGVPDGRRSYAGLVLDPQGNLYGTTYFGGASDAGTVFKVTPTGTETVLYSFSGGADGGYPYAGLVRDPQGNLYGTTYWGGAFGDGTVFKVTPTGTETVLHTFNYADGAAPYGGLVLGPQGNLYGTTVYGGAFDNGTVFKVTPTGTETVLHNFTLNPRDGRFPYGDLVLDPQGNLYGTTFWGGVSDLGTVFKLTRTGTLTVLHSFRGGTEGIFPYAGLVRDPQGNLYGTTVYGGAFSVGTVFMLIP